MDDGSNEKKMDKGVYVSKVTLTDRTDHTMLLKIGYV